MRLISFNDGTGTSTDPIAGLRADIVPHRQWVTRRWYYANPLWYYHCAGLSGKSSNDGRFYTLVDQNLKVLCQLLHECGIRTSPSCQGHFYGRSHFERAWQELCREAQIIRTNGLIVKDCETNYAYNFFNPRHQLPWSTFGEFHDHVGKQQHLGYLGVILPCHRRDLWLKMQQDSFHTNRTRIVFDQALSLSLNGWMFHLSVRPRNPRDREMNWSSLTRYFERLLLPTFR